MRIQRIMSQGELYLVRFILLQTRWVNIYLHRFVRSDNQDFHDHPFNFMSIVLFGSYTEYRIAPNNSVVSSKRTWASVAWRDRHVRHRVEINRPCWTLMFTGPRQRPWLFWPMGPGGYRFPVYWEDYLTVEGWFVRKEVPDHWWNSDGTPDIAMAIQYLEVTREMDRDPGRSRSVSPPSRHFRDKENEGPGR